MHTEFWPENLKGINHLKNAGVKWEDNIKMDVGEMGCKSLDWI
jgi:hypothetical protein